MPSSSTGKYHNKQSNGEGGLLRHSKAVVYFASILCRAYGIEGKQKDIVTSACILHDIVKYGLVMQKYTTKTHDKEGADFILNLGKDFKELPYDDLLAICCGVAYHMGQWTTHPKKKRFPEDYTNTEVIVHLADMCSAGKEVSLGFLEQNIMIG